MDNNKLFNKGSICVIYDINDEIIVTCDNENFAQLLIKNYNEANRYEVISHIGGEIKNHIKNLPIK